jgi:hypothetical protein
LTLELGGTEAGRPGIENAAAARRGPVSPDWRFTGKKPPTAVARKTEARMPRRT